MCTSILKLETTIHICDSQILNEADGSWSDPIQSNGSKLSVELEVPTIGVATNLDFDMLNDVSD